MSTNYYVIKNKCDCCGRSDRFHIGHFSAGWSFLFHGYEDKNVTDFSSWKNFIKEGEIFDEYDRPIEYDELLKDINLNEYHKHRTDDAYVKNINGYDFLFCDFC